MIQTRCFYVTVFFSELGWPGQGVLVGKMDCTTNRVRGREEVAMVRGRDFRAAKGVTWVGFVP